MNQMTTQVAQQLCVVFAQHPFNLAACYYSSPHALCADPTFVKQNTHATMIPAAPIFMACSLSHPRQEFQKSSAIGTTIESNTARPPSRRCECGSSAKQNIVGNVRTLSEDKEGCREVQRFLDDATDDDRLLVAAEFTGHIFEALCCPNANHVLQKLIVKLPGHCSQYIIDELIQGGNVTKAVRHRYGCRILERLIEHCREDQLSELVEEIIDEAIPLSRHSYASYVIQHLFEHGTSEQVHRLLSTLALNVTGVGSDGFSCAVLHKALENGEIDDRLHLARALLKDPNQIVRMARTRRGYFAVKAIIKLIGSHADDFDETRLQILSAQEKLQATRYGRTAVAACKEVRK